MTDYRPTSKPRSERAHERKGALTCRVLGDKLAFVTRSALHHSKYADLPQGAGPLPTTEEACSSVAIRQE